MKFYIELTQEIIDNILSKVKRIELAQINNIEYFGMDDLGVEIKLTYNYPMPFTITRIDTYGNSNDITFAMC